MTVSPISTPELETLRVRIEGRRILDCHGRQLLLRGINAGGRSKLPPFMPFPFRESGLDSQATAAPFDEALARYCDQLQSWGLSLVRLPFSWEALEPIRGAYDDAFLDRYFALARACGERAMRVIVDFHQDVFARPYAGDGFPLWACPQPAPDPAGPDHHWFMGYLQNDQVQLAFDRFWRNDDGLRDAFAAMWRHLATRLWQLDNVIGFEVINEPGWGSAAMYEWAKTVLTPFYAEMATVVRAAAPDAPIFFDSTGGDALSCTTGLERPTGDGLVFAPHFYAPEVIMEGRWSGNPNATKPLSNWSALGEKWDLPVLLGEFGVQPTAEGAASYLRANYDKLDELLMHGTLWECSTTADGWNEEDMSVLGAGGVERPTVAELVRPYPRATAGTLDSFRFDSAARRAELRYHAEAGGVTEIAAPRRVFAGGVAVMLEGVTGATFHDESTELVLVRADEEGSACVRLSEVS